jgi:elongation factor G
VAYRETVAGEASAQHEYTTRAGEKTLFGHVALRLRADRQHLTPQIRFEIPADHEKALRRFLPAIRDGLFSAVQSGRIAGYPLIYLECVVTGARVTSESAEPAYSAAALQAFRAALEKMETSLLEPHMRFEVVVPEQTVGDVLNDLNRRGAEISMLEDSEGTKKILGNVPLSKMFGYATSVRSLTQGRGSYTLEPFEYRTVPASEFKRMFGNLWV